MISSAIVIPIYREKLTKDEEISLFTLKEKEGCFDLVVVAQRDLEIPIDVDKIVRFDRNWFSSRSSYSRLLLSQHFYESFQEYGFILVFQLDC